MSVIGANTMTKISEQTSTGGDRGGRIVWSGPADGSVSPPATFNNAPLDTLDVVLQGGKKTITAGYGFRRPDASAEVIRDSDGTGQEVPIRQHPNCSNRLALDEPPVIGGIAKPGVESYIVPAIIYRRSAYSASFTWSESNLTSGVGTRSAPTGLSSPTTGRWLTTGLRVQEQVGGGAIKTETWQYSPTGWDTDIYS